MHPINPLFQPTLSTFFINAPSQRTLSTHPINAPYLPPSVRIATWLGLTWLTGAIFPLVFLLCALVFSAGPNRRLFGADPSDLPSSWELATGQHRLWSLNVFQQSAQLGWSGSGTVHVADSSNMWVNAASSGGAVS